MVAASGDLDFSGDFDFSKTFVTYILILLFFNVIRSFIHSILFLGSWSCVNACIPLNPKIRCETNHHNKMLDFSCVASPSWEDNWKYFEQSNSFCTLTCE